MTPLYAAPLIQAVTIRGGLINRHAATFKIQASMTLHDHEIESAAANSVCSDALGQQRCSERLRPTNLPYLEDEMMRTTTAQNSRDPERIALLFFVPNGSHNAELKGVKLIHSHPLIIV